MKKLRSVLRLAAFALALFATLDALANVLLIKRTDGIIPMKAFYSQRRDTVDVLLLGSSHIGANLSTAELWERYGIASFDLWGSVQPFWNSYYNLKEALKTQSPRVVVLEMLAATMDWEYSDDARQIVNTEAMHMSLNKVQNILVSAPPERWGDLLTVFPVVHTRYNEITQDDFQYSDRQRMASDKGDISKLYSLSGLGPGDDAAVRQVADVCPLPAKQEKYLRKIVELCRQKDLPLLFLTTYSSQGGRVGAQPAYNRVQQIADEYGIPYLNANLAGEDAGFEQAKHICDDGDHLNYMGARHMADWLGAYLKEHYDLPDRRGDPDFQSWDEGARLDENAFIASIPERGAYFAELTAHRYLYCLIRNNDWEPTPAYNALWEDLTALGFGTDPNTSADCVFALDADGGQRTWEPGANVACEVWGQALNASYETQELLFNGRVVAHMPQRGLMLVVYDPLQQTLVDVTVYAAETEFALTRI